jgi:hypothetical protein
MTTFTFPQTTETIDAIRGVIGRNITFNYLDHSNACPVCNRDAVTNESTNPFCLVCSGTYWIPVYSGYTTLAHIFWGKSDNLNWFTGGQIYEGDCRVQVKYSIELVTILNKTKWIEVDGEELSVVNRIYRGSPEINRIILDLKEG